MEPVPVAQKLLKTKLFGFSLQRLLQSFGVPLAPGLILTVLNFPALIFGPAVGVGIIAGALIYVKTPAGQDPATWLYGVAKFNLGPDSYVWKPVQIESEAPMIQYGDTAEPATNPRETQTNTSMIGDDNTIENMDFEAVHDDGVLESEKAYSLIIEVEATQWLTEDQKSKEAKVQAFSQFLMGLKAPVQILTMPVPYDTERYKRELREANQNADDDQNPFLKYGRTIHGRWLENVVERGSILDRRFFIVVTARKDKKNERDVTTNILDRLKPSGEDVDEDKRYDEVWARADNVTNAIPRTGANASIIREREEVLRVLFRYYKGREPPENLDHGWLTEREGTEVEPARRRTPL